LHRRNERGKKLLRERNVTGESQGRERQKSKNTTKKEAKEIEEERSRAHTRVGAGA